MKIVKFLGGLGNQMFQYAFYKALSAKYPNVKAHILGFDNYELHNGFELEKVFNIEVNKAKPFIIKLFDPSFNKWLHRKLRRILFLKKAPFIEKREFCFNNEALEQKGNQLYWGYWQTEKYFESISEELKKDFEFINKLDDRNLAVMHMILNCNSVSIHIRRGDYINHTLLGGICDLNYYKRAIQLIEEKISEPVFFIFSNDIHWCKRELNLPNAIFVSWNTDKLSYIDMHLMSNCKHNIIANSSFSWWAAWLNKNNEKTVIAPKKWTNDPKHTDIEILPKQWIKL
jgi:hypothetical protein